MKPMKITRRQSLALLAAAHPALRLSAAQQQFDASWESLKQYRCPDWFRDAKFGIWAHWGPQCVPQQGDWYARNMYIEGSRQYEHHVATYGHPSKFGFKDIVPLWKAERFEPETLMARYQRAGAKYFVALAAHHDNYDCWNSRHHRWNSVETGPRKDIVGMWRKAALARGMRFGVTEHLARSWSWFNVNKGADKKGPLTGVPYDGNDPKYADFYFEPHEENGYRYPKNPPDSWKQAWLRRITDLVDQYQPDLLYTDGGIPFGEVGRSLIAHFYQQNRQAVYTIKNMADGEHGEYQDGVAVLDMERGVVDGIHPSPWQTDTCIGGWYYHRGIQYKRGRTVIHMLADIVSKNGNLLLNFPLRPDGTLDRDENEVLEDITAWMRVNAEAIHRTRPWKVFGEGPTQLPAGNFNERNLKPFTPEDFRFTTHGETLYAICLGVPETQAAITSLGAKSGLWPGRIASVRLLGDDEPLTWARNRDSLLIDLPERKPSAHAVVFRIIPGG